LTSLYMGYMDHTKNRCLGEQRRWCALHVSGHLNIADGARVSTIDLTQKKYSQNFQKAVGENKWWIKPQNKRFWESIAALPGEEAFWNGAFSDAIRLGEAKRDPDILFCGFFWKMSQAATKVAVAEATLRGQRVKDFNATDWRIRLFLLRSDGVFLYHSWKEGVSDIEFCRVSEDTISRLAVKRWSAGDYVHPFQVTSSEGKTMVLAGVPEDLELLTQYIKGVAQARVSDVEV